MEWLKQFARLFGWKNRQYESLLEFNEGGYKVRLWITQKNLGQALNPVVPDIASMIRANITRNLGTLVRGALFEELMAIDNVACVAIVDSAGNGVSAYPDWH